MENTVTISIEDSNPKLTIEGGEELNIKSCVFNEETNTYIIVYEKPKQNLDFDAYSEKCDEKFKYKGIAILRKK